MGYIPDTCKSNIMTIDPNMNKNKGHEVLGFYEFVGK